MTNGLYKNNRGLLLDCFSGISGDMFLGAIVDAGISIELLSSQLKALPLDGYELQAKRVSRAGIAATKVDVLLKETATRAVYLKDVRAVIDSSALSSDIKEGAIKVFNNIFEAEARVHGATVETVHLHELGGIDCMVDVVGSLIGLKLLGIDEVFVTPINLGGGTIRTAHGQLPVPAPATAELLKGFETYLSDISFELTTPTGAALVSTIARPTVPPSMIIDTIGYGAGKRDIPEQPNVLRCMVFQSTLSSVGDTLFVVESNIDDMNPQYYEPVMARLFGAGARDVYIENIIMKKGRPAIKLTVLCDKAILQDTIDLLFTHTTTIGVRYYPVYRQVLKRESIPVETSKGTVRLKVSSHKGKVVNQCPEFEDMLKISEAAGIPLKEIEGHVFEGLIKRRDRG